MPRKHKKSPATIAIKGAYGYGNFGDDALMIAVSEVVNRVWPSADYFFVGNKADYVSKLLPGVRLVASTDPVSETADLTVYGGGTQFYSFPLTYQIKSISLVRRILNNLRSPKALWRKILRRIPTISALAGGQARIAIGIGLGPFVENSEQLAGARRVFSRLEFVSVRDVASYEICKEWECENLSLGADLCYLPGLWDGYSSQPKLASGKRAERIGVIVRDWPHSMEGDSYADALFEVVATLRSQGREVQFVCFAEDQDPVWVTRLDQEGEDFLSWQPEKDTVARFLSALSTFDLLVTSRYHGAVFSSLIGKPVVCIEVEPKLRLVSELLGSGASLWSQPFTVSECLGRIGELEADYFGAVNSLAEVTKQQGKLVEDMVSRLQPCICPVARN